MCVVERVKEGLFFAKPAVLPRGRHGLPRQQALTLQRERMMAAIAELMAEHGYEPVRVGDISARAGVSRATFYECFENKQGCAFAAYDRFIEVLLQRIAPALDPAKGAQAYAEAILEAYLGTLEDDPVVGRAFLHEIDAVGAPARSRRRASLRAFADGIRHHHEIVAAYDGSMRLLPDIAYLGIVYGVRQLASDGLDQAREPDLRCLIPDLTQWILAAFRGNVDVLQLTDPTSSA